MKSMNVLGVRNPDPKSRCRQVPKCNKNILV